jgi:hypothetical protein
MCGKMPKLRRSFRWVRSGGDLYLLYQGEVVRDLARIKDIVLTCPYCGARAERYYFLRGRYVYVWHFARGQGKHQWCIGPRNPLTEKLVENLPPPGVDEEGVRLTEEERRALYKVFIRKKRYTAEEAERARAILRKLLGA